MRHERPASVTALAVLHLVGGILGLLCVTCAGGFLLAGGEQWLAQMGADQDEDARLDQEIEDAVDRKFPAGRAIDYGDLGASLVLGVLLIVAAVGLLNLRPWGRALSLVYAVASIVHKALFLVAGIVGFAVRKEVLEEMQRRHPELGADLTGQLVAHVFYTAVRVLFVIYPIVVLIVLTRPRVVKAFNGADRGAYGDRDDDEGWGSWQGRSRHEGYDERDH
jgi:hypothetical protein